MAQTKTKWIEDAAVTPPKLGLFSADSTPEKTVIVSADRVLVEDSEAGNAKKWTQVSNLLEGAGANEPIEYAFAQSLWGITTSGYGVMSRFKFAGTDALGEIPSAIKLVTSHTSTTANYRIYDLTNALVICELIGTTNALPEIVDLGTLSNLPTGEAIWELQAAETGPGKLYIDSLHIEF